MPEAIVTRSASKQATIGCLPPGGNLFTASAKVCGAAMVSAVNGQAPAGIGSGCAVRKRNSPVLMTQVMADAYGCNALIEDAEALLSAGQEAVTAVGATVIGDTTIRYVPHGLTIGLFLAESHLVLSTWPEFKLLCIDTLLCNPDMSCDDVIDHLVARLCPDGDVVRHRIQRRIAAKPDPATG